MACKSLKIEQFEPKKDGVLLLGFTGWMDGGNVATGTIKYLVEELLAQRCAHIESPGFYLYNFPGDMDVSALFRPHTVIKDGMISEYDPPGNEFFFVPDRNLFLFTGKEPNMAWEDFADCVFAFCKKQGVAHIYSIGSVAGVTPHTREPRVSFSASHPDLKEKLLELGLRASSYEGPASIVTYLTVRAPSEGIGMASLVVEIPAYVQGYNPRGVETTIRVVGRLTDLHLELEDLIEIGDEYLEKLNEVVEEQPDLAEKIKELERDYDREAFSREMSDLRGWLGEQGIRVD